MLTFVEFLIEDRARAERILKTLHQMTTARGATPAEEANAKARIAEIHKKYGISSSPPRQDTHRSSGPNHKHDWSSKWTGSPESNPFKRSQEQQKKSDNGFDWHAFKKAEKAENDRKKAEQAMRRSKKRRGL